MTEETAWYEEGDKRKSSLKGGGGREGSKAAWEEEGKRRKK